MFPTLFSRQTPVAKQLNNIVPFLQQTKKNDSARIPESLQQILNFYFGTPDKQGALRRFGNQFSNYEIMEWAIQLQRLLQHISPYSSTFNQLLRRSNDPNSHIVISKYYLPSHIEPSYFQRSKLFNLRISHSGIILSGIDAFILMLVYQIYHSQASVTQASVYENLMVDQFFSSLTQNPLLILLRKCLEFCSAKQQYSGFIRKIMQVIKIYFFDEILMKYEQDHSNKFGYQQNPRGFNNTNQSFISSISRKSTQIRYKIKVIHLHAIYLCLRYCPKTFTSQFAKYSQAISQYFSSLKPEKNVLQAFIRVWIYGMTVNNQKNTQNLMIQNLKNANSKQGWFFLKRYSPTQVYSNEGISIFNISTALNIIKIIQKQTFWSVNPSYLWTFACFMQYLNSTRTYYSEFSNSRKSQQLRQISIVQKVFRLIVERYDKAMPDILNKIKRKGIRELQQSKQIIQHYQNVISKYFTQYFKIKNLQMPNMKMSPTRQQNFQLPNQLCFRVFNQSDLVNAQRSYDIVPLDQVDKNNSQSKRNLVAFYKRQPKGCWQIPIQYNESVFLYYIWFTIAKILDFVIPGKRQQPFLNIRFLANPITFIGLLAIILVFYLIFR